MSESIVLRPLQTAVATAVSLCLLPSLPIKYLGRIFTPSDEGKYLEIIHIPNNAVNESWGSERLYRGVLRLILHWPINDAGIYVPSDLIAEIAGYFTKNRVLWNGSDAVKVIENPLSSGMLETDRETLFVYTVEYQLFKP